MFSPKVSKTEFSTAMLPHTRREVFSDVIRFHWAKFLLMGAIIFVFALPLNLSAIFGDLYKANLSAQAMQGGLTDEQLVRIASSLIAFSNYSALLNIVLLMIFSIGFAGISRIIRQFAWEDNVNMRYDFTMGIKQNFKQMLLLAFIIGLISFLCVYIQNLSSMADGEVYQYLGIIPIILIAVIFAPPAAYASVSMTIYSNTFRQNMRIGFTVYFKYVWKTLLAIICCGVMLVPQMIPNIVCHIIGRTAVCFLIPFVLLGWYLFTYNQFDKVINERLHPELVGKGTVPLKEGEKTSKQIRREERMKKKQDKKNKSNIE